jgi:hypothetical protein
MPRSYTSSLKLLLRRRTAVLSFVLIIVLRYRGRADPEHAEGRDQGRPKFRSHPRQAHMDAVDHESCS